MSLKEEFLKIITYEEYDKRRSEFKSLDWSDKENGEHLNSLFPKMTNSGYNDKIHVDVFKK